MVSALGLAIAVPACCEKTPEEPASATSPSSKNPSWGPATEAQLDLRVSMFCLLLSSWQNTDAGACKDCLAGDQDADFACHEEITLWDDCIDKQPQEAMDQLKKCVERCQQSCTCKFQCVQRHAEPCAGSYARRAECTANICAEHCL